MIRLFRGYVVPDRYRKIVSAEEAVKKIKANDTIVVSGFVAQGCPDALLAALESRFAKEGSPKDLNLIFGGGPGDYGTKGLNRLATHKGMLRRTIGGHYGQVPEITKRVLNNEIAAWTLPMGCVSRMIRAAGTHTPDHVTRVGLGTFVDPRQRGGTLNELAQNEPEPLVQLCEIRGNEYLRYRTIPIRVALLKATTADVNGNLTMERESLLGDTRIMANAVRASGGLVIAQVNRIAALNTLSSRQVHVPGPLVDYIVEVNDEPMSFFTKYDPSMTGEIRVPVRSGKLVEAPLKDERAIIARRAALELQVNDIVNLGIGMPEGVARVAQEEHVLEHITLTTEAGVVGGQACSGHEFGPGKNFDALVEMSAQFDFYNGGGLNCAFLGMGQVGKDGSVNVSRLSKDKLTGPGGFMDIVQNTRKVVFMGTFFKKGQTVKTFQNTCGYETTFDGQRALRSGQEIIYVSERAVFQLNYRGLKLVEIAPGLDLQKDILDHLEFLPHGVDTVKRMDDGIFDLSRPVGLSSQFFNIDTIVPKRVAFYDAENLFFINLSKLAMLNADVVQDFTESILDHCSKLWSKAGKGKDEQVKIILKLDHVRIPPELQKEALATFSARFEKGFKSPYIVLWSAREKLNKLLSSSNSDEFIQNHELIELLWRDWAQGRRRLSKTRLRAHLEHELAIRVQPERLQMIMGGKEVVTLEEFPQVVSRIHQKISW